MPEIKFESRRFCQIYILAIVTLLWKTFRQGAKLTEMNENTINNQEFGGNVNHC